MNENNDVQGVLRERTLTRVGIAVLAILVLLVLGGMIYAFVVPVP